MAPRHGIGDDRIGPVAESVDAGAMHCSLSWFKSRPGLQPSRLCSFGAASQFPLPDEGLPHRKPIPPKMPVDGASKTLSRLRNLV
jgi:hypothetical protein